MSIIPTFIWLALAFAQQDSPVKPDQAGEMSEVVRSFVEHARQYPDGRKAFTFDMSAWSNDIRTLPIGVFDSGIGGLTVQEAILSLDAFDNDNYSPGPDGRKDFERERFIYFGDQANMPYGNYSSAGQPEFLKELILKDAAFLLGRRYWPNPEADAPRFDKPPVKAIVIACNTATAWGMEEIRQAIAAWKIPVIVIGVVEAGARGVMEDINSADQPRTVAVLATVGTCGSNAYPKAIGRATGLAGKRAPEVVQQGSLGLAGAIEGDPAFIGLADSKNEAARAYLGPSADNKAAALNKDALDIYGFDPAGLRGDQKVVESIRLNSVANYVRYDVATLVLNHKSSGKVSAIDTVVLGCTHFPLVEQEILDAFARVRAYEYNGERPFESVIAEIITVVDPAEMTAKELFREMARRKLFCQPAAEGGAPKDLFFMSVANSRCPEAKTKPDGSLDADYKYGRQPSGLTVEDTIGVPMQISLLPVSTRNLIQSRLPEVWTGLSMTP
jgi:glutamate racemase